MLIELDSAIKHITYYIDQLPPKYDVNHWVTVRKHLRKRKADLEEFIFNGELDVESWYNREEVRSQIKEYLISQGVDIK